MAVARTRLLRATVLAAALFVCGATAISQSAAGNRVDDKPTSVTYTSAGVDISVPAPPNFVQAPNDLFQLVERLSPTIQSNGEVVAWFVLPAELVALQRTGRPEVTTTFTTVVGLNELRNIEIMDDEFNAIATKLRTGVGQVFRGNAKDIAAMIAEASAEFKKRFGTDLSIQPPMPLGIFDDDTNRIGVLIVNQFSANGQTISLMTASSLVRVRRRVFATYVYGRSDDQATIAQVTDTARLWTSAILAANPDEQKLLVR